MVAASVKAGWRSFFIFVVYFSIFILFFTIFNFAMDKCFFDSSKSAVDGPGADGRENCFAGALKAPRST